MQASSYNSRTKKRTVRWVPVLSGNARAHWTKRAECMHKDRNAVYAASKTIADKPPATPLTKARVDVALTVTTHARRDRANLTASLKGVMDGLVLSGYIIDDNIEVVDGPHISVTVGQEYGYTVIVTPAWSE
jgi:hypothetical protein